MRFDADIRDRLRRRLLRRGEVVAALLAEVLAGKDKAPAIAALGVLRPGTPGIRPEEALRNALHQIESRRRLLIADDDRYGRCDICGIDLGVVALDEMAWADRCAAHAAS